MKIRPCPVCRRESLFSNGGFWLCAHCGFAVTQSAMLIDERRSNTLGSAPRSPG